jgi:DNA replication licensing factor MCM2
MIFCRDYASNEVLDRYSDAGIDDDDDVEEISAAARRAAEAKMARRDRTDRSGRRGQRAARRSRPAFLGSDDMEDEDMGDDELGIASMKKRTRKQYDERRDLDDLDGIEDASRLLLFSTMPRY